MAEFRRKNKFTNDVHTHRGRRIAETETVEQRVFLVVTTFSAEERLVSYYPFFLQKAGP